MKNNEIIFSDIDLSLSKHIGTGDIFKLKNDRAILRSIKNILLYKRFDRKFNTDFNGGVSDLLFELDDGSSRMDLEITIRNIIETYEPRVKLESVNVSSDDDNRIKVDISFYIIGYDEIYNGLIFLNKAR